MHKKYYNIAVSINVGERLKNYCEKTDRIIRAVVERAITEHLDKSEPANTTSQHNGGGGDGGNGGDNNNNTDTPQTYTSHHNNTDGDGGGDGDDAHEDLAIALDLKAFKALKLKNKDINYLKGVIGENFVNTPNWRNSFIVYKAQHDEAIKSLLQDETWLQEMERLNPGIDVRTSVEKASRFWGSEDGWKKCKSRRSVNLNWKRCYENALCNKLNRVAQTKTQSQQPESPAYKPQYWKRTNETKR